MIKLKKLLTERRRYEAEVMAQSRYIINQFKIAMQSGDKYQRIKDVGSIPAKYIVDQATDDIIETPNGRLAYTLDVRFYRRTMRMLGDLPFIIEAAAHEVKNMITIQVYYNPAAFPNQMNYLVAEIKDTLRHELEHIAQFNLFGKESYEYYRGKEDEVPFYKYLLLRHEVPAFVRGLYKTAKTKRIPLSQAIEEFFEYYENHFTSSSQVTKVRKVWTNYAKQNIQNFR